MTSLQTSLSHHARRASPAFVLDNQTLWISAVIPSPVPLLQGFVLKILRHQIQLPIAEPQPVQDHRYCGCSHAHTATLFSCWPIEPFCYPSFFADSCYDPQMIQSFRLILHFL